MPNRLLPILLALNLIVTCVLVGAVWMLSRRVDDLARKSDYHVSFPSYLEVYLRQKPISEEYAAMAAASPKPVVPVSCAALSPDGRWLAIGTPEKLILWDMAKSIVSRQFHMGVAQAAFLDNETLATITFGQSTVYLWNTTIGRYSLKIGDGGASTGQSFMAIAPHPSGTLFALASRNERGIHIELYSKSSYRPLATLVAESADTSSILPEIRSLAFAGHGSAVFALFGTRLRMFRVENNLHALREDNPRFLPLLPLSLVSAFAIAPDGKHIVWGDEAGRVRVSVIGVQYPLQPSTFVYPLQPQETAHNATVRQIALSKDGKRMVSASEDGIVVVWDTATMRPIHRWSAHPLEVTAVLFTPDGKRLITADAEGRVKIWNVRTGKKVRDIPVD